MGVVPWCDSCDRFLSPSTVKVDGTCPSCGRIVDPGHAHAVEVESADAGEVAPDDEALPPIPWHLWLLAGALAVYLGYRAMQGIEWLLGAIH
jgi:hypothetical protein